MANYIPTQGPLPNSPVTPKLPPVGIEEAARQKALAAIRAMTPGSPEQEQAIEEYSRDYGGQQSAAQDQMRYANQAINLGQPGVTQTGGRFGTTVAASPLEHLAAGLRSYKGYKDMNEARKTLKDNSEAKQRRMAMMLRAGL